MDVEFLFKMWDDADGRDQIATWGALYMWVRAAHWTHDEAPMTQIRGAAR